MRCKRIKIILVNCLKSWPAYCKFYYTTLKLKGHTHTHKSDPLHCFVFSGEVWRQQLLVALTSQNYIVLYTKMINVGNLSSNCHLDAWSSCGRYIARQHYYENNTQRRSPRPVQEKKCGTCPWIERKRVWRQPKVTNEEWTFELFQGTKEMWTSKFVVVGW